MSDIPVFRIHNQKMEKDRFSAIAEHLGLRANIVATDEALFVQDKQRALAYALPGSRFAGLLFFTDHSQAMGEVVEHAPGNEEVDAWAREFQKRFQLDPRPSSDERVRISSGLKVLRTDAAIEEGKEKGELKKIALKTDVVSELRVNDLHVTGPRAKVRMVFKHAKAPAWIHHAQWEKLDVFEARPRLTEDEAYRRISDLLASRGRAAKTWRMIGIRLAYFAGEFNGGPDLLLPYYFAEIEFRDPKEKDATRQGPRRLIQVPACR